MRTFAFCLALPLAFAACSSGAPPPRYRAPTPVAAPVAARPVMFRFQVGDELAASVWKEADLATQQKIQPDGTISPPLLKPLLVAGLTVGETQDRLTKGYTEFLKDPKVSVHIVAIHSARVFVAGEVKTPQAVPMNGAMTAVESIVLAGGFLEESAAKSSVHVVRKAPDGSPWIYNVDAAAVLNGWASDLPLQRGDIVYVPTSGLAKWGRALGQALAPVATVIGTAGSAAAVVIAADTLNRR